MKFLIPLFTLALLWSCSDSDDDANQDDQQQDPPELVVPSVGMTFDWQLDDVTTTNTFDAEVIDVDAFTTSAETVQHFKDQGKIVIAYLSVGSLETFRPDAAQFPAEVIGNVYDGFFDENWLDIRNIDIIGPIMQARLDMIADKGFDGIEPDNINGYQNDTGFPLTQDDALTFSRWLITEAHSRNLSIGQKNAEELVPEMVSEFDWMLMEDAYADDFKDMALPYIAADKAVFVTEYTDRIPLDDFVTIVCPDATGKRFTAILKDRDLTADVISCN